MTKLTGEIVAAIQEKKGHDICVLDLSGFDGAITDAFVVCSADSPAQVEAIARSIEEGVSEKAWRVEGLANGVWVVIDYVDAMVHIFQREAREFYKLEQLWADAPITKYDDEQ